MVNRDGLKMPGGFTGQNFGVNGGAVATGFLNYAPHSASGAQNEALSYFDKAASGEGPSVAVQQLAQANQQANRDAFAMTAMGQGGNLGSMQQMAQGRAAQQQMQAGQAAAEVRAGEMQAGMAGYADQANALAQQRLQYEAMGQEGLLAGRGMDIDYELGKGQLDLDKQKYQTERNQGWAKMGASAVGGIIGGILSDKRRKTDIEPAGSSGPTATERVGAMDSYEFGYADDTGKHGRHTGVMAQDVERVAPELVHNTREGKVVDGGGLAALNTAAISEQQRQIKALSRGIDPFVGEQRGNVDLRAQPRVKNADGSISTVDSASFNINGQEVLLPSVTPDGRHLQSDDEIVAEYNRTGRHLGMFDSPERATGYAQQLHDDYAAGMYDSRAIDPFTPTYADRPAQLSGTQTIDPFAEGGGMGMGQRVGLGIAGGLNGFAGVAPPKARRLARRGADPTRPTISGPIDGVQVRAPQVIGGYA